MATRLFVYGTLRRGEANHALLARATFAGEARTPPDYTLYAFDGHPGMGTGGTDVVVGECWLVDDDTLRELDVLEDHPHWYRRQGITLADGTTAETYVLPPRYTTGRPVIPGGDWARWRRGG